MTLVEFIELCIDRLACGGKSGSIMTNTSCSLVDGSVHMDALAIETEATGIGFFGDLSTDARISSLQAALKLARGRGL